jgi:hypothetical protein
MNVNKKESQIVDHVLTTNLLTKIKIFLHRQVQLLEQRILADKTTPTFSFDPNNANRINQVDDLGLQSSRWQMQKVLDILSNSSVF